MFELGASTLHRCLVVEEVLGFAEVDPIWGETPLVRFAEKIVELSVDGRTVYCAPRIFDAQVGVWAKLRRPRTARSFPIVFVKGTHAGF